MSIFSFLQLSAILKHNQQAAESSWDAFKENRQVRSCRSTNNSPNGPLSTCVLQGTTQNVCSRNLFWMIQRTVQAAIVSSFLTRGKTPVPAWGICCLFMLLLQWWWNMTLLFTACTYFIACTTSLYTDAHCWTAYVLHMSLPFGGEESSYRTHLSFCPFDFKVQMG